MYFMAPVEVVEVDTVQMEEPEIRLGTTQQTRQVLRLHLAEEAEGTVVEAEVVGSVLRLWAMAMEEACLAEAGMEQPR